MHDITGYMLCSPELNMQALFMYTYMCVCVYFWCLCECTHAVCVRARAVSGILLSLPIAAIFVWMCVSTVACLEAAELWMLAGGNAV